jgi:hypothetical protein
LVTIWRARSGFRYFDKCSNEEAAVFVASGLLDPKLPQEDLLRVNYHLPKNLIDGPANLGIKIITFGTVKNSESHRNAATSSV